MDVAKSKQNLEILNTNLTLFPVFQTKEGGQRRPGLGRAKKLSKGDDEKGWQRKMR